MSILRPENYIEKIHSYSEQDWKPILDLIPKIEKVEKFGVLSERAEIKKGVIDFHPYEEHEILGQFRDAVYSIPIIINFDWGSWDEGRKMVSDENFDYDSIDIPEKCKIITAIVRNDRFCDGALISSFESGMMLKVLKSIYKQLKPMINGRDSTK